MALSRAHGARALLVPALLTGIACAQADEAPAGAAPPAETASPAETEHATEDFGIRGQFTYVEQEVKGFHSPYVGPNSLTPYTSAETVDVSAFIGKRLWPGAQLWVQPEIDQGFGLRNTLGVAGFPSGEAYKVGENQPYFRLPRAFIRDTINLGDDRQQVESDQMTLAGSQSVNRVVVTFGKFSVVDVFDTNQYAHDPKTDFLNWAVVDAGSFDYAADAWGYTLGAAVEWYQSAWVTRFGVFDLSDVPNSPDLEPAFHEFQLDFELERGYQLLGAPGKVRLTSFLSRGRMATLDQAIAYGESMGTTPQFAPVRQYRSRPGASLNIEQQITPDLGAFFRTGKSSGNVETYEFTDIDWTYSGGLSMQGKGWSRPNDTVGIAGDLNYISGERQRYLALGGLGVLVGDGQLPHPGPEKILETFYSIGVLHWLHVTLDYQFITNPAYNRDRGPISVYAVRVHGEF